MPKKRFFLRKFLFLLVLLFFPALLQAEDWIYRIRPGETLSAISTRFLLPEFSTAQLQAHNNIEDDRGIPVGTEIRIPLEWLLQSPAGARIVFLRGEVDLYHVDDTVAATLKIDDRLELGDRVVTGPSAVVSIRFADSSRLLVGPDSEIILDTLSAFGETGMVDTRLRVKRGRVESRVRPLEGEGSRYEIHTPAAVTMVRGTGFRVGVEGDSGLTRNEVTEGDVAVEAGGETVSVAAGFGTLIEPGKAPTPPSKLLASPDLSELPAAVDAGSVALEWPPLDAAKLYRLKLQVAGEEDAVLLEALLEEASYTLQDLQAGHYLLLLRGIDELGLEGLTARHALQVNEVAVEPVPPPPPEPEPKPVLPLARPAPVLDMPSFGPGWMDFRWSQVKDAWGYRLTIARDSSFQDPLFERIGMAPQLRLPFYWQGRLYVRVDALFETDPPESHSGAYRIELPGH